MIKERKMRKEEGEAALRVLFMCALLLKGRDDERRKYKFVL